MIPVDYMLNLEQVFTAAVIACIAECGDLRILNYTQLSKDADLITTPSFGLQNFKLFLDREESKLDFNNASFDNHLERDHYKPWHDQPLVLALMNGIWVHIIVDCTNKTPGQAQISYPPSQLLPRLKIFARPVATCIAALEQSITALSEDLADGINPLPDWIWASLNDSVKVDTGYKGATWTKRQYQEAGRRLQEVVRQFPFSQELRMFETRDRAGITSGHFIPGDVVFLVDGALDAVLLREVGVNVYRVVGQCCLLGARALSFKNRNTSAEIDLQGLDAARRIIEIY